MKVGVSVPKLLPDDPRVIAAVAADAIRNIEDAGFSTVWIPDVLNRGYTTLDPLTYAASIGSISPTLEIGTAVLQVGRHGAVDLAHRVLTAMALCGGRLTLGAGMGSTPTDFEAVGANFADRRARFDENLAALRTLLGGGVLDGVQLLPAGTSLVPPIVIGAWRSTEWIERAATEFDGWIGSTAKTSVATLRECLHVYRAAGGTRAIAGNLYVDLTAPGGPVDDNAPLDLRCPPQQAAERLRRLADLGFDEVTLTVFDHSPEHLNTLRSLL